MYISKSRFINWTRCPMYFPMDLKNNPTRKDDIDIERERREEMLEEMRDSAVSSDAAVDEDEEFDASPSAELEALLPFYNKVEDEALKVARKYFAGTFVADSRDVHNQKLFEYKLNGHTYRCYVDIYNENDDEINIIEVKATTSSKYAFRVNDDGERKGLYFSDLAPRRPNAHYYALFVKNGNIWRFNTAQSTLTEDAKLNFENKKGTLLERYDVGKYPHDLAFQRFVIENALREAGDERPVNYYLAVLNHEYVYDGAVDEMGSPVYNEIDGQEIITFFDMNETSEAYQPEIREEIAKLENYISAPHDIDEKTSVGKWCFWGKNTECVFCSHCFQKLRFVPDSNKATNYLYYDKVFRRYGVEDKYWLINNDIWKFEDVDTAWLNRNQQIQRDCYDNDKEHIDKKKMLYWLGKIDFPIYHFDFESFPCPLPRFRGESPYRQSVFEFSLHIERDPGICDKEKDNYVFLNNECCDDEREALAKAIIDHFEFNEDGSLHGTMLAQNTSFERLRLEELAELYPEYKTKLLAIRDKSADLIHLLKTKEELYIDDFGREHAKTINYYHKDLSGSYSIKKTLPVLVPDLSYKDLDVGNGVQAYITYLNYDSPKPTFATEDKVGLKTKEERREALKRYCQQDTWAMVEILRAIREKIKD